MSPYRLKTLKELFSGYQFENDRIDKKDSALTKSLIKEELHRRIESSLNALDEAQYSS